MAKTIALTKVNKENETVAIYLNEAIAIQASAANPDASNHPSSANAVLVVKKGSDKEQIFVTESLTGIGSVEDLATRMIAVTDRISNSTVLLNADRIISMSDDSELKALVEYDAEGAVYSLYKLDETAAAVQALIDAL